MILTCPRCATRYLLDADQLPPSGRTVRCAACGERWLASPPDPEPPLIMPIEDVLIEEQAETVEAFEHPRQDDPAPAPQSAPEIAPAKAAPVEPTPAQAVFFEPKPVAAAPAEPAPAEPAPAPVEPAAEPEAKRTKPNAFDEAFPSSRLESQKRERAARAKREAARARAAALLTLAVMVAAVVAAVTLRATVVQEWPAAAGVYSALGLH